MSSPTLLSKYPFPPVDGRLPEILFSETIEELQTVSQLLYAKKHNLHTTNSHIFFCLCIY